MKNCNFLVVVGASAGGLQAINDLLTGATYEPDISIVFAQHQSPSHKSLLPELLQRETDFDVVSIEDGQAIQGGYLYVCPANAITTLTSEETFQVHTIPEGKHVLSPNIDELFTSAASHWEKHAAAVVLSGTGRDGSVGSLAMEINAHQTFAQEPNEAQYETMPANAIKQLKSVQVLKAKEIFSAVQKSKEILEKLRELDKHNELISEQLKQIIGLIDSTFDTQFARYNTNTTFRRIWSRMAQIHLESVDDYYAIIKEDEAEQSMLYQNFLIGVSDFFRDAEIFDQLRTVLEEKIAKNEKEKVLRGWIAGCSRGQEAYSIAMLIDDILGSQVSQWDIKVFCTDLDEQALMQVRSGVYSEVDLDSVPEPYRNKYFTYTAEGYQVTSELRELLIITQHDLIQNPPFSRLDFVSCRNVIIYFTDELKRVAFTHFKQALKPGGLLILGKSEGLGNFRNRFKAIDAGKKIFVSLDDKSEHRIVLPKALTKPIGKRPNRRLVEQSTFEEQITRSLWKTIVQRYMQHHVVLDSTDNIIYLSSENPYIQFPTGVISSNLFQCLKGELQNAYYAVKQSFSKNSDLTDQAKTRVILNPESERPTLVTLHLNKINDDQKGLLVLSFYEERIPSVETIQSQNNKATVQSHILDEIHQLRAENSELIQQISTNSEEMQATNEELQSSNEELHSTNEELASTNAELEATVEELETAYATLRKAYEDNEKNIITLKKSRDELTSLTDQYRRSQAVAQIGHWIWNIEHQVISWSEEMYRIFQFPAGTEISVEKITAAVLPEDQNKVVAETEKALVTGEFDLQYRIKSLSSPKKYIWVHGRGIIAKNPATKANEMLGTVQNIDSIMELKAQAKRFESDLASLISNNISGIYIYSFENQTNTFINRQYKQLLGYDLETINNFGEDFVSLFHSEDWPRVQQHMDRLYNSKEGETFKIKYRFKHAKGHWISLLSSDTVSKRGVNGEPIEFTGAFVDITDLEGSESHYYSEIANTFSTLLSNTTHGSALVGLDGSIQQCNSRLASWLGYEKEELLTKTFIDITHPEDLETDLELYTQLVNRKISNYELEKRYLKKDGKVLLGLLSVTGFYNRFGVMQGVLGIVKSVKSGSKQ